MDIKATRLNWYDNKDYKPFHLDVTLINKSTYTKFYSKYIS